MNRSNPTSLNFASLGRAAQHVALFLLAGYLVIAGGKFAGLVLYPLYLVNVWLVVLGGLAWMVWRALSKRPFPATPLDLPLLAWVAVLLISALASEDPRISLERWVYELVCVLIFYLMVDLERAGKRVETWVWLTILAGVWLLYSGVKELLDWYLQWFAIGGWADPIPPATIRVQATMGHANVLAAYLNLLWPLAAVRLLAARSRWVKTGLGLYVVVTFGLIFFTSSRGGWLGSATALAVLLGLLALDRRDLVAHGWAWLRARKWILVGITIAGLVVVGVSGVLLLRQMQHPSHYQSDPRGYIWRVAFEMFRESPLLGAGSGAYLAHILQTYSIPPGTLLPHAHNYLINLLGENGVLGAAAGAILGGMVAWLAVRAWRAESAGKRTMLAGAFAALAGLAVHSQFEIPQVAPLVNILTAALLAQLVGSAKFELRRGWNPAGAFMLGAGWLAAACLALFSWWGYAAYQRGADAASSGNWAEAARWMDEAVRRDPSLAHYQLQAGMAHSELALDGAAVVRDPLALARAIDLVKRGLAVEGSFALDWAALGALEQARGNLSGAVNAYARAAALAPESVEVQLALGQALEEAGQDEEARMVYRSMLEAYPDLVEDAYWEKTLLRQEIAAEMPAPAFAPNDPWQVLKSGAFGQAEELFRGQLGVNDANSYLGLALALAGQGKEEEAERAFSIAEFVGGEDIIGTRVAYVNLPIPTNQRASFVEGVCGEELFQNLVSASFDATSEKMEQWMLVYHRE